MDDLIALPMAQRQQSILYAVQNYGKRLFRFIRSRVKSDQDAEDILQDVWFQLSSIVDSEPVEQLSAWLYRVSRNKIVDKSRKQTTLSLEDLAYEDDEGELVFPEEILADETDPDIEFERAYFKEMFFDALNKLPEKQKQVFIWNVMEDMTLQQIADKTGESIKTIISRKRYAVAQLRERLQNL
jgi:RNA polymerase sigma factor (sigma-70 family)